MSLVSSIRCKIKILGTAFPFDLLSSSRTVHASFMGRFRIKSKEIQYIEFIIFEFSNLRIKDVGQVSNLEPCSGQREIEPLENLISS